MSELRLSKSCRTCGEQRLFIKQRASHGIHLIVTILTVGFWLPIWLLAGIAQGLTPYRCTQCGSKP